MKAALAFEGPGELKFQVEGKLGGLVLLGTAAAMLLLSNIVVLAVEFIIIRQQPGVEAALPSSVASDFVLFECVFSRIRETNARRPHFRR